LRLVYPSWVTGANGRSKRTSSITRGSEPRGIAAAERAGKTN
jgi:hypothetical protein